MKSFDKTSEYLGGVLADIYMFLSTFAILALVIAAVFTASAGRSFSEYAPLLGLALGLAALTYIRYRLLYTTKGGKQFLMYRVFL